MILTEVIAVGIDEDCEGDTSRGVFGPTKAK